MPNKKRKAIDFIERLGGISLVRDEAVIHAKYPASESIDPASLQRPEDINLTPKDILGKSS